MDKPTIEECEETSKVTTTETVSGKSESVITYEDYEQEGEGEEGEEGEEEGEEEPILDRDSVIKNAEGNEKAGDLLMKEKDYSSACGLYCDALKNLSEIYGPLSPKVAHLYVKYGNSLILTYKQEESENLINLLGSKIKEFAEKGDNPTTTTTTTTSTTTTTTTSTTTPTTTTTTTDNTPDKNASDKKNSEKNQEEEEEDISDDRVNKPTKEKTPEEEEEEATSIQIAWEVLETARIIYEKEKGKQIELSDVHVSLGDLFIDSDQIENAIQEYTIALGIRKDIRDTDHRSIAEIHYSIGLAHQVDNKAPIAEKHYRTAIDLLHQQIALSQKSLNNESDAEKITKITNEIQDLKNIIVDLQGRLDEVVPIDTSNEPVPKELQQDEQQPVFSTSASQTPIKPGTPVNSFGVVGKSARRSITPSTTTTSTSTNTTPNKFTPVESITTTTATDTRPKRRLEDLMNGTTPDSFSTTAINSAENISIDKKQKL